MLFRVGPLKYVLAFFVCSVALLLAFVAGVHAERFAAADACLDAGGAVVKQGGFCVQAPNAAFAESGPPSLRQ